MTARELVAEHIAAFNAHDSTRLLAGLAENAVWATGRDVLRGRAALAELFDDGLWALEPHLALRSLIVEGPAAAAQVLETITVEGARAEFAIAVFFETAGDLITSVKVYREGSADL